ncbi:hypothetical protein JCM6882_007883 [Rhodosporidiobolus microsporus]
MLQLWRTCVQAAIHWPSRLEAFLTSDPVIHCTAVPAWFAAYSYLPLFGRELGQVAVPGASAAWAQFASKHESIGRALPWWPDRFPDDGEKLRRALGDFAFTTFDAHLLCNFCVALVLVQWQVFPLLISFFRRWARSRHGMAPYLRIEERSKDVDGSLADLRAFAERGKQSSDLFTAAWNDDDCKVCVGFYQSWCTLMSGEHEAKRRAYVFFDLLQKQPTAKSPSNKLFPLLSSQPSERLTPRAEFFGLGGHASWARALATSIFPTLSPSPLPDRLSFPATVVLSLRFIFPLPTYLTIVLLLLRLSNKMYALLPPDTALVAVLDALPAHVKHCDEVGSSAEEALSWNYPQMEKERVWIRAETQLENAILDAVLAWKEEKEGRQA